MLTRRKAHWSAFGSARKARLCQQIVETALHLFRQRGYENTRIDDIVQTLELSQPPFFRYFPELPTGSLMDIHPVTPT